MWLSEKLTKTTSDPVAEIGKITLSSDKEVEATASFSTRDTDLFLPYGVDCLPPSDESVLILSASGSNVAVGTRSNTSGLECGEVRLHSSGGAYIALKNDGSVIINGLKINKNGEIENA